VANLEVITGAAIKPAALLFGAADMAADLGSETAWEPLLWVRSRIVQVAATNGVAILDSPYFDIADADGLKKMPAKIIVRLQDGRIIEHEVPDYPGLASDPFTWEDAVEQFDSLVAGRVDQRLSAEIKDAARSVESIQVRDLMELLGSVKAGHGAPSSSKAA